MKISRYTKEHATLLKGVAILLIVLHNFFHNIPPVLGENEFHFNSQLIYKYLSSLQHSPREIIRLIFSIWGHYGVGIFIFLSAYGLSISYEQRNDSYNKFIKIRFKKLYVSFLICLAAYISLGLLKSVAVNEQVLYWDSMLWKLLLISNLIPGEALMPVGPWWFIPFIFQFYFVFPLIHKIFKKYGHFALLALSITGLLLEWFFINDFSYINYTFLGHLPLICFGIWFANKPSLTIKPWLILLSIAIFIAGNLNFYFWSITDLAIIIIFMAFYELTLKKLRPSIFIIKILSFYGGISLHLFLVNGFLRSPFHSLSMKFDQWWVTIIMAIASLIFSTIFALILGRLDSWIRDKYTSIYKLNQGS